MVEVVNSALSLWAEFHSMFPSSKSRSQKWKKVWFPAGRRNDSCSPWRCDVHQGEGEGWRLAWPWTSTTRVCLSVPHPQHCAQQELQDVTARMSLTPPAAPVPWQGTNTTVALRPKMPTGCGIVTRGANQPHPSPSMVWVPWGWQEGTIAPNTLHGIMGWDFTLFLFKTEEWEKGNQGVSDCVSPSCSFPGDWLPTLSHAEHRRGACPMPCSHLLLLCKSPRSHCWHLGLLCTA